MNRQIRVSQTQPENMQAYGLSLITAAVTAKSGHDWSVDVHIDEAFTGDVDIAAPTNRAERGASMSTSTDRIP